MAGPGDNPRDKPEGEPILEQVAPIEEEEVENPFEVLAGALLEALRIDRELNDALEPRRMVEHFRNVLNAHGPFGFGPREEEEEEEEEEDDESEEEDESGGEDEVDQVDAENSAKN